MRLRFVASTSTALHRGRRRRRRAHLARAFPVAADHLRTNPNSTGLAASISVFGSQRISDNNFTVSASAVPAGQFGIFFFGEQQDSTPLAGSSGILCVSSPLFRLPVVQADPFFGSVFYTLDFTDISSNASMISAGSTQNFQLWFRDLGTSNTTDGIAVEFGL